MVHKIDISPEVVKLARQRTRSAGTRISNELARGIVVEAVINAEPEADLILDEEAAYSSYDELTAAFDVNDIVVNGVRIDVRPVDEDGRVSVSRALVGTSYMTAGTLAVALTGALNGKVVGFVEASQWQTLDKAAGDEQVLFVKAPCAENFEFATTLASMNAAKCVDARLEPAQSFELATMVANKSQLPLQKQRALVEYTLTHQDSWPQLQEIVKTWSAAKVNHILTDAATWNQRVERISKLIAPKFKNLSGAHISNAVAKVGEKLGGQPESPAFRKLLLSTLAREELAHCLGGAVLKKACNVVESVISGRSTADAVKDAVPNKVAGQIANQIKSQRRKVAHFVDATAQELSAAFQQLALQPAYATHSNDPASGMESINEALKLIDAAELAESMKELDSEMASL